jgi:drug/metabolite transporter (DMT)-like permease
VAYLLALLSAASYGAADFMGGLASRGASTILVVAISQTAGFVVLAALLPMLPDASPVRQDIVWGLAAGVSGSIGVALLYRALAIGTMAIVAPTTAVCAVVIPVMFGMLAGERPPLHALAGIGIALLAIVLVSQDDSGRAGVRAATHGARLPRGLGLALLSGVAIGFFFLSLARTDPGAGLWPLLAARGLSVALFGLLALRRLPVRVPGRVLGLTVAGGILDMLANALYLIAVRQGPLTSVVTLSSLYPASTVLLAGIVLRERLNRVQMIGIAAALAAVMLIVS